MADERPNLDAIARRAGVSRMSVSRALNGQKGVSESTRLRVLKLCREMNYTLVPEISAAMRTIRQSKEPSYRGTLGLVSWYSQQEIARNVGGTFGAIVRELYAEAHRFGYGVELIHAPTVLNSRRKLTRRLLDSGVSGLILGPHVASQARLELEWEHFATVALGYSIPEPQHHRIISNLVGGIELVCERLRGLGYERVALVIPYGYDLRVHHLFSTGYLGWQQREQRGTGPLMHVWERFDEDGFTQWVRQARPDALVTYYLPLQSVQACGLRIPEDVGLVHLDLEAAGNWGMSGLNQNQCLLGALAVQRLAGQLSAADVGVPSQPTLTLVNGQWVAGRTTRCA